MRVKKRQAEGYSVPYSAQIDIVQAGLDAHRLRANHANLANHRQIDFARSLAAIDRAGGAVKCHPRCRPLRLSFEIRDRRHRRGRCQPVCDVVSDGRTD
jgi:hypothetical protein